MKASIRRRIGDEEFMPDSRLAIVSRSEVEEASVSCSGEENWHAGGLDREVKAR